MQKGRKVDRAQTSAAQMPTKIPLAKIRLARGVREKTDIEVIERYGEAYANGALMPPVTVFDDGKVCWLADGYLRVEALGDLGIEMVDAVVLPGGNRDATLHACGMNETEGLPRTPADKLKAVTTMLDDAEWGGLSSHRIAELCGVECSIVTRARPERGERGEEAEAPDDAVSVGAASQVFQRTESVSGSPNFGARASEPSQVLGRKSPGDAAESDTAPKAAVESVASTSPASASSAAAPGKREITFNLNTIDATTAVFIDGDELRDFIGDGKDGRISVVGDFGKGGLKIRMSRTKA